MKIESHGCPLSALRLSHKLCTSRFCGHVAVVPHLDFTLLLLSFQASPTSRVTMSGQNLTIKKSTVNGCLTAFSYPCCANNPDEIPQTLAVQARRVRTCES